MPISLDKIFDTLVSSNIRGEPVVDQRAQFNVASLIAESTIHTMRGEFIRGVVTIGWLVCLILALTGVGPAIGCRKPKSMAKSEANRETHAVSKANLKKDHYTCFRATIRGGKLPRMCCRQFQLCGSFKNKRQMWSFRRALEDRNAITDGLALIVKCVINIVSYDKDYFIKLGCCDILPWPFYCSKT